MLFADKLGMPKKIKDLAESLDLEVTNHHDPEFDAKLCALISVSYTHLTLPTIA